MIWQDVTIMAACFGMAFAMIPSILGKHKPAKSSCIITIMLLIAIAISFATLGLWLSFCSEIATITAWVILLFQGREQ